MSGARRIVIETRPGEVRAAALDDTGRAIAFRIERETGRSLVGGIYLGQVQAVRREIGAAFVDIGIGVDGFLNLKQGAADCTGAAIVEGAAVPVQVSRDAAEGKGPALSSTIDIVGAALVLTPGKPGLGLSGRISDDGVRARLKGLFDGQDFSAVGLVVRTGAEGMADTDILAAFSKLQRRWQDMQEQLKSLKAPAVLQPAPGLAERMVNQFAGPQTREIIADDTDTLLRLQAHVEGALDASLPSPLLCPGGKPAFEAAGLEEAFEAALSPFVALPSGGSLIISETPAMTAVDVNAGRAAGGNPERLALETNLEAATALAYALRLRGIGGLIAVDFLKMREEASQKRVLAALGKAFRGDPESPRTGTFSRFGLVDIVRQSRGPSLGDVLLARTQSRTPESAALDALAGIERRGGSGAVLRASPAVCACLEGPLLEIRKKLERKLGFVIRLEPVPGAGMEMIEVEIP